MTPVLKNWHIIETENYERTVYHAYGTVFGHTSPRCADGTPIHTTSIKNIVLSDNDTLEIHTRNTVYHVKLKEYGTLADIDNERSGLSRDKTSAALERFNIPEEIYARMAEYFKVRLNQHCADIVSYKSRLETGEIYLALSANTSYYFDFGMIKQPDETVFLHKYVHSGMFQDSVLLMKKYDIAATSYFPYKANNLAFYKSLYISDETNKGTRVGYLRNTGDMPLNIRFTWGKCVVLMPDEEIEVRYQETGSDDVQLTDETDKYS